MENELMSLPMVALRGLAVLPEQVTHFDVSREKSVQAITQAMKKDQKIFLVMQKEVEVEEPKRVRSLQNWLYCNCKTDCKASGKYETCSSIGRAACRSFLD